MGKNKFKIDFPDESQIKLEVEEIISKGMRRRESFYSYLKNMYKDIGLKYIFHDMAEIIFVILSITSVLLFMIMNNILSREFDNDVIYSFIFIISPILYLSISSISFINTRVMDTYEIEMICKYNIYQISAFRMLMFSMLGIISNTMFIYFITINYEQIEFLKAFMVSTTSLFLYSIIFLYMIMRVSGKFIKYLVMMGWIVINLTILLYSQEFYDILLKEIPMYIYLFIIIITLLIYIKNLKKLITFKKDRGKYVKC